MPSSRNTRRFYFLNMSITGVRRVVLTPQAILQRISEYDIFRFYMPDKMWKPNQATLSPFRNEENPSFVIGNKHGSLSFIDFADSDKRGDCFTFVKLLFNLSSIDEVLRMIDRDFGLGISSVPVNDYKKIIAEYKQPEDLGKRYSLIQAETRAFTHEELAYWNMYYQSLDDLRVNHIYSIKHLYLNRKKFCLNDDELRFGYFYNGGYWKLYRPFASKKNKWISNVPLDTAYGLGNLNSNFNTLVCKSLKDYMVCLKIYPYVCHVQNESLAAFSHETVAYIKEHSKEVYYGGDSDKPGKEASYAITGAFGFKHINPPDMLLPDIKDFADWGRYKGLETVREHFIKKGLI